MSSHFTHVYKKRTNSKKKDRQKRRKMHSEVTGIQQPKQVAVDLKKKERKEQKKKKRAMIASH